MSLLNRQALLTFFLLIVLGLLMALAGSDHGGRLGQRPLFAVLVGAAFIIQWVAFIPAYAFQTEKFFDLTGSVTYIVLVTVALMFSPAVDERSLVVFGLVVLWAVRLGLFLFRRIHKTGKDARFDTLKPAFLQFLNVWTMQAVWITFTLSAALVVLTTTYRPPWDGWAWLGLILWAVGFGLESVADAQKSRFNADPANAGRFIHTGLWAWSRHPNYLGEMVLWLGMAVIALPVLQGWQWVALSSPLFVYILLTRISGIPLLEQKAEAKWGGQPDYEAYKQRTPVLIPRWPRQGLEA